VNVDTEQR